MKILIYKRRLLCRLLFVCRGWGNCRDLRPPGKAGAPADFVCRRAYIQGELTFFVTQILRPLGMHAIVMIHNILNGWYNYLM